MELKGNISFGKLNWWRTLFWVNKEGLASETAEEKNIHGKIPERINKAKSFISVLKTAVNTKVITNTIKSGFIITQKRPKTDPAYLALNCFHDIPHKERR